MEVVARKRWSSSRGIRLSPKTKRLWVKGLHRRVTNFFRLLRSWCCRRRPAQVRKDGLYYTYTPLQRSNSFYADAIADCIDFIKRSS